MRWQVRQRASAFVSSPTGAERSADPADRYPTWSRSLTERRAQDLKRGYAAAPPCTNSTCSPVALSTRPFPGLNS